MVKSFKIEKTNSKNSINLEIKGSLVLSQSEAIKEEIKRNITDNNELKYNIKIINVEDIDYSFLQILISVCKSHKADINITMNLSEEHKSLIKSSGIIDLLQIELINNK